MWRETIATHWRSSKGDVPQRFGARIQGIHTLLGFFRVGKFSAFGLQNFCGENHCVVGGRQYPG